ncbi:hypothetical protein [Planctomicrobium sp. SH527]|uniref:hypothetical protein n=1 Tax=Planctomicrobium sp. SH527 TaxID=3448123 RepID=UPI003F5C5F8A
MQAFQLSGVCVVLMGFAGCQCFTITERYQDVVDNFVDKPRSLERWYDPGLDLTRIGYPDWYQHKFNDKIYDRSLSRGYRALPNYAHNPIYVQPQEKVIARPIPVLPGSMEDPLREVDPTLLISPPVIPPVVPPAKSEIPALIPQSDSPPLPPNGAAIPDAPPTSVDGAK